MSSIGSASAGGSALVALSGDLAAVAESVGRSVVAIHARRRIPASGILWRPGVVVAANHTISRDEDITVTLHDGTSVPATLAGRDPSTDLAVLRLDGGATPQSAPAAAIADDSTDPRVGQLVLALGRPGRGLTASLGIVSAVGGEWRTWQGGTIDRFVRLDLSIYDGFSGGPLVEASGRVVGLNTSGLARATAVSIPASTVNRVTGQLLEQGRVARGYLGIATQPVRLPPQLRKDAGIEQEIGLVLVSVESGAPAEKGGLLIGDILVGVDGRAVTDPTDVLAAVSPERIGQTVELSIVRAGRREAVHVTVGERPRARR